MAVVVAAAALCATVAAVARLYTPEPLSANLTQTDGWLVTASMPIQSRDTFARALERAGVPRADRMAIIAVAGESFDVRKLRAGAGLTVGWSRAGTLESLECVIDPDHRFYAARSGGEFSGQVVDVPSTVRTVPVCGTLRGSLFESVERTGERAELALSMAEVFAWDVDFYTDPREGDKFCLLVEKKEYANGQPPIYQRVLAGTYDNAGTLYDAYLFPDRDGKARYYSGDGRSLQSAFLRSPMKFDARVSSHFSMRRLHPVLKIARPHLGTDYAAPVGTPVQALGAGVVTSAGWSGQAGNLIAIKHAGSYETLYMHLSRILVRRGERVEQGRTIGLVGSTGLATGPHLDFRVRRGGAYVDFERLRLPRVESVSAARNTLFAQTRDRLRAVLESGRREGEAVAASSPATSARASLGAR
jgi:murein DD-endopeptidase MepM/ murein hydrolase activator NlpD